MIYGFQTYMSMEKRKKKAIVLARVSTEQQSLDSQAEKVLAAAKADGYGEPIVIQNKESAVKNDEEHLLGIVEMKQHIEEGDVECVYCSEISRLSRRPRVLYSLRDYFIEHGVQLVCLNPHFKLLDKDGKLDQMANIVLSLFSTMAENEGMLRSERCLRGRYKKRDEGKFIGGKLPFGYSRDDEDRFVINEEESKVVRRIFNMYVGGKPKLAIARQLRQEGYFLGFISDGACHTHINNILHNADYTGLRGRPQIISQNLFDRAQEKLNQPQTKRKKIKRLALGQGLMFNPMSPSHRKKFYVDTRQGNYYCLMDVNESRKKFIRIQAMDEIIWNDLKRVYKQQSDGRYRNKEKKIQHSRAQVYMRKIEKLQQDIAAVEEKVLKVEERLIMGKITAEQAEKIEARIYAGRDEALKQIEELRQSLEQLQEDGFKIKDIDSLSDDEKQELAARLIHHIDLIPTGDKYFCRWQYTIFYKSGETFFGIISSRVFQQPVQSHIIRCEHQSVR